MKNAKTLVLIGAIILTLESIFMIVATALNTTVRLLGSAYGNNSNLYVLIVTVILTLLSWKILNSLSEKSWRTCLLVVGIILVVTAATGNLIVGVLYIIAFILANKAAKQ